MPITLQPATLKYKNSDGDYQSADSIKGDKGDTGAGVPSGGTAGQFLKKNSGTNYDTVWENPFVGTELPTNANLNDCTTPGYYRVVNADTAATITNMPVASPGCLHTEIANNADGSVRCFQTFRRLSDNNEYKRSLGTSGWTAWVPDAAAIFNTCLPYTDNLGANYNTITITLKDKKRGAVNIYGIDGNGKSCNISVAWDGDMTTADVQVITGNKTPTVTFDNKTVKLKIATGFCFTAFGTIQNSTATWGKEMLT